MARIAEKPLLICSAARDQTEEVFNIGGINHEIGTEETDAASTTILSRPVLKDSVEGAVSTIKLDLSRLPLGERAE